MAYSADIHHRNPTAFLFVIEQSGSMNDLWMETKAGTQAKSDAIALQTDNTLPLAATKGEDLMNRFKLKSGILCILFAIPLLASIPGCSDSDHREASDEVGLSISEAERIISEKEIEGNNNGWSMEKIEEETRKEMDKRDSAKLKPHEKQEIIDSIEDVGRKKGWSKEMVDQALIEEVGREERKRYEIAN